MGSVLQEAREKSNKSGAGLLRIGSFFFFFFKAGAGGVGGGGIWLKEENLWPGQPEGPPKACGSFRGEGWRSLVDLLHQDVNVFNQGS